MKKGWIEYLLLRKPRGDNGGQYHEQRDISGIKEQYESNYTNPLPHHRFFTFDTCHYWCFKGYEVINNYLQVLRAGV